MARRIYITQYGYWWSTTASGWRALVAHALAHDGIYDLSKAPDIKALRCRPSTVRIDDSTGRTAYVDTAGHRIHQPLDWTLADWDWSVDD